MLPAGAELQLRSCWLSTRTGCGCENWLSTNDYSVFATNRVFTGCKRKSFLCHSWSVRGNVDAGSLSLHIDMVYIDIYTRWPNMKSTHHKHLDYKCKLRYLCQYNTQHMSLERYYRSFHILLCLRMQILKASIPTLRSPR